MKQLPGPEVYEKEFKYMPWGILITRVLKYASETTPKHGSVLDLMCGPGYLLKKLQSQRKDLKLTGVDIDKRYISYAKNKYPKIEFVNSNSLKWTTPDTFDLVLCTAGLHHLTYKNHEKFIAKISSLVKTKGIAIIADPYVEKYTNEYERRQAAAKLGYEYLKAVLINKASDDIVSATIDIMHNDVLPNGEYKTYIARVEKMVKKYFAKVKIYKTWPKTKSEYGDYYFILTK